VVPGHLFSGRYKALIVDGSGNGYLRTLCDYVDLNPVRAKLIKKDAPLEVYAGGKAGDRREEGGTDRGGGTGKAGMVRTGFGRAAEDRRKEDIDRGSAQKPDGDDAGMDCGAVEDGMSARGGTLPEENHP